MGILLGASIVRQGDGAGGYVDTFSLSLSRSLALSLSRARARSLSLSLSHTHTHTHTAAFACGMATGMADYEEAASVPKP